MENNNCRMWSHLHAYSFKNACPIRLGTDQNIETTYIIYENNSNEIEEREYKIKAKTYPTLKDIENKQLSFFRTFTTKGITYLFELHADSYHLMMACLQKFFDIYGEKQYLILLPFSSVILEKLMLIKPSPRLSKINEILREVEHRVLTTASEKAQCEECSSLEVRIIELNGANIEDTKFNNDTIKEEVEKMVNDLPKDQGMVKKFKIDDIRSLLPHFKEYKTRAAKNIPELKGKKIIKITTGTKNKPRKIVLELINKDVDVHPIYPVFDSQNENLSWQNLSKARPILSPSYEENEWWETYCGIQTATKYSINDTTLQIGEFKFTIYSGIADILLVDETMFETESVGMVIKSKLFNSVVEVMDNIQIQVFNDKIKIFVNNQVYEADLLQADLLQNQEDSIEIGNQFKLQDLDENTVFKYVDDGKSHYFKNIGVKRPLTGEEKGKISNIQNLRHTKLNPEKYTWSCLNASKINASDLNQITPFFGSDTNWVTSPQSFQKIFPDKKSQDFLKDSLYHTQLPKELLSDSEKTEYILDLPRTYNYSGCRISDGIMVDEVFIPLKRKNYYIFKKNYILDITESPLIKDTGDGTKPEETVIDIREDLVLEKSVEKEKIKDDVDLTSKWLAFVKNNVEKKKIFQMYYMCIDLSHIVIPAQYNWTQDVKIANIKWNLANKEQIPKYSYVTNTVDFFINNEKEVLQPTHFALFLNKDKVAVKFMTIEEHNFANKNYKIQGNQLIEEKTEMHFEIVKSNIDINSDVDLTKLQVKETSRVGENQELKFNHKHKLSVEIIRKNFFGNLQSGKQTMLSPDGQYLLADFESLEILDVDEKPNYEVNFITEDSKNYKLFELEILQQKENPIFCIMQDGKLYVFTINRSLELQLPCSKVPKDANMVTKDANMKYLFEGPSKPENLISVKHPIYLEEYALLFKDIEVNDGFQEFNAKWLFDKDSYQKNHFSAINAVQTFHDKVRNFEANENTFEDYFDSLKTYWEKISSDFFLYAYNEASTVYASFLNIKETIETLKVSYSKDAENALLYKIVEKKGLKSNMGNSTDKNLQQLAKHLNEEWSGQKVGTILFLEKYDDHTDAFETLSNWEKRRNRAIDLKNGTFAIPIASFKDFDSILADLYKLQTVIENKVAENAEKENRHFIFQLKSEAGPLAVFILSNMKKENVVEERYQDAYKLSMCKVMNNKLIHGTVESSICAFDENVADGVTLPKRKVIMSSLKDEVFKFATLLCKNTSIRNIFYTPPNSNEEFVFATIPTNINLPKSGKMVVQQQTFRDVATTARDNVRMMTRDKAFDSFF